MNLRAEGASVSASGMRSATAIAVGDVAFADDDDGRLVRRAIQLARAVALVRVAQQHHDDRCDRQREQHAEESEQLAAGEHREDHRDRMQADLFADQPRHQHVAFERLADREHDQHERDVRPVLVLHERRDHAP